MAHTKPWASETGETLGARGVLVLHVSVFT